MDRDPKGQQVMSLRLSRVLRDIGVTRQNVARRRRTYLILEKMMDAFLIITNHGRREPGKSFVFGSQSEGTTTLGMESDTDILTCYKEFSVIKDWADWEPGKRCLLLIKNDRSPPQHCCIQIVKCDCPLPETLDNVNVEWDVEETMDGRVLLKNTYIDREIKQQCGRLYRKQGPSRSNNSKFDYIHAFSYNGPLFECNFLFTRPKPGHWPRPEILAKARQCETFLVPQGHAESDQSKLEWRFSTSQIERLLMFDLNILQIQVYTFLKILRRSFFKPLVGDRLSTFHFKTALLFTLETYPPEIWQERNLLQCVLYCLKTLQRWFNLRHCPHYTISGVDLFVGKLRKWEYPLLSAVLSDMIDNIMDFVSQIEMDQIGERIGNRCRSVSGRYQNTLGTAGYCCVWTLKDILELYWRCTIKRIDISKTKSIIIKVGEIPYDSYVWARLQHAQTFLYQYLASVTASTCIRLENPIPPDVYRLYEASLDSDLTSSRLKFASMMYCSGQYERAKLVLAYTEALVHADVLQNGRFSGRSEHQPTERFLQKVYELPVLEVIKRHVACKVAFNSLEICCVPGFLVYEMHRTIRPEDFHHRNPGPDDWMDLVVIDSTPFMFYLQYLTFRQLGEEERRLEALDKLNNYVCFESRSRGPVDTALHVLGHCFELENRYDLAWTCYRKSLDLFPYNNAARWHIIRLLQQS
ncbi:uncharacterized protein LOC128223998 [Mya arenaria]|uniref:uncharacterized protein LOC128223998 n=1 Tax=Mya arenaria TaxID=6604 RepID=UPI0022E04AF3|nr:uncharacterized protein LOC128223998 [Mya arenaria]XP_052789523.1 uncharacterized protein LOC128223998 [Mya arenaria]XP_052789525.1 uncharacterized protein LOC128223998 [Mya arenaria]